MKSFITSVALFAAFIGHVYAEKEDPQQPTVSPAAGLGLRTPKPVGCFTSPGDMWDMGPYTYQSSGWCQPLCVRQSAQYFAVVNGTNCFCGNSKPKSGDKVDDTDCNVTCNGIKTELCGGTNKWWVYDDQFRNSDDTGSISITKPSQTWFGHDSTSTSSSSSKKTKATPDSESTTSEAQSIVLVTVSGKPVQSAVKASSTAGASSGGPNKAGIAVGVVVGVVVLAAVVGAAIFFIRRKKQRELEDERRRHEAISSLVRGEKPPSTFSASDSRLEPSVMFQRRQSDGSIADNQDYSRRILKVTNPDDR